MNELSTELTAEEIAEIERHKYFLSEKAGHDVGWEFAEEDWRANFADQADETVESATKSLSAGPLGKLFKKLLSKAAV